MDALHLVAAMEISKYGHLAVRWYRGETSVDRKVGEKNKEGEER